MITTVMAPKKPNAQHALQPCVHHWRIAEHIPEQRYSSGACVRCGVSREWDNWAVEDRGLTWAEIQKRQRGG